MKKAISFLKSQCIKIMALVGAMILIVFSLIGFNFQIDNYIHTDMRSQVEAIQENSVRLVQNELNYLKRLTESAARMMAQANYTTDAEIVQALRNYADGAKLSRTLFITLDGYTCTNYAGYVEQDDDHKYLNGITLSEVHGTTFSQPWYSDDIGEVIVDVVSPVALNGKNGVLVSSYNIAQLYTLLENEFMGDSVEIGVLNQQGEVVVGRQMSEFQLNIFDALTKAHISFSNHSTATMRQDFEKGLMGFSSYYVNDVERYCSYAPVKVNDWYIIVMVQEIALRSSLTALEHYGAQLTLKLVLIMTALLLIIVTIAYRDHSHVKIVLQRAAMIDGLTDIYNRITVESKIAAYLEEDGQSKTHALFIMDIDNFKLLNDHLGHAFGDLVLKEFADRLKEFVSDQDIIGRIGGDEFIVLIKNCPDVAYIHEKANQIIDGFFITTTSGTKQPVFISLGIALFDTDGHSFMALYQHADAALYRAKKLGKSRFSF